MMPVENNEKSMDPKIYFLPHHAVMKGDSVSTKLRVVFDGTCKPSNGNSINSILGIGKMLQPDLFTILVKFRLNEIAFSTDIQQMYRQILIDQEYQNFHRIVWRESKDSPIREYKLCTVTYGTASAPYLATRCLFQTGLDLERDDPAVSSLIKESFYIDDLMAGAPSSEEAISLIKTLSNILEARGFHLRKWRSNSSEVLSRISSNWLWLLKLDWDSPLPEELATKWKTFQKEFEQVCSIHIPRWIHTTSQQITLHGFCDASELAYASVIYAVQPQADGNTKVTLLVAKSRVAPLKYRATTSKQLMGDLPTHRVTPSRPFSVCGVDYAGPINILRYRGRGAKTTKGYIALFVCFVTKALHLELVSDLTSEAFITSLNRFCARRGAPKHIYCDNGTTFVGARRKLLEIFKFVSKLNENEQFCYFLSQVNIEWHFSPPVSPHFGGLWEAGVKSEVITSSPEHTNDDKLSLRSRWDIVQKMKLGFWRKWKMDYLSNLQNRTKWKSPNHNIKVGEIVIIKEDNIPPATWPLGKVIETHPGKDGVVRVVTLRTVKGRFKRPIHKLCKLPLHQE
ncbi:integrase catalytic domain-containing protein [Trichonephila clavipes]|nr:integrase catalytic domain-containing protein [Trichonephila clavipes]